MRNPTYTILLGLAALTAGTANSQPREIELVNGTQAVAREVLVKLRVRDAGSIARIVQDADAPSARLVGGDGVVLVRSRSRTVTSLMSELPRNPNVVRAEPNYILRAVETVPNDPYFNLLYAMKNTGQTVNGSAGTAGADIKATLAWDTTRGSAAIAVGVVDTGVDYTHLDLAANVWSAPQPFTVTISPGVTVTCGAGTRGFNSITQTCDPKDDHGHGTHVSGTIGASGNNGIGVAGVNWTTSIVGLKFLDSTGSGTTADAVNAIEFAIQLKLQGLANIRVLSNSWGGGGYSQTLSDEIGKANTNDILFVAAAGNNSSNNDLVANYPSNYGSPNVVAVAATDNKDLLASFSNYGASTVDLGAPGVNIASTYPGNQYYYMSGTSMATPHVSGAAALLLSKCALSTAALKSTLMSNIDIVSSLVGKTVTGGRLNVYKALTACTGTPATPDFTLSVSPAVSVAAGGSGSTTATVTPSNGFASAVTLSASGLPTGATATFGTNPLSGPWTTSLTFTTSATTPSGTYTITVTGTGGGLTRSATVSLTVTSSSFTLTASPGNVNVKRGKSASYTVTVGTTAATVSLSVSGVPSNASATFTPESVTGGGTSTLTVTTTSSTPTGAYVLVVMGTGGGTTQTDSVKLTVR